MEFDLMTTGGKLREIQELARGASEAGFSGMVFTESGRTAYLSATAAALATENFDLGTGIAVAFPRSPMVTAKVAWELADASAGHFHLGIGTQVKAHIERRYSSEFDPPGPRVRDYLLALRAIFSAFQGTSELAYEGEFYRFSLLPRAWSPGPIDHPDVPLLVAAVGPWMCRMAGEIADGIHVHPLHHGRYLTERLLPAVADGADAGGRDPSAVKLVVPVFTIVGDSEEERQQWKGFAKAQIGFYGSTRNYAFMFDMLGYEGTSAALNERMKAGDIGGMAEIITDEMLDHFAVTATWDELADRLLDRYRGVADRLVMYFADPMIRQDPSTLGKWGEVARAVRAG